MSKITIFNEDCFLTMNNMIKWKQKVDCILTSPPYNTNKKAGKNRNLNTTKVKNGQCDYVRYDVFVDNFDKYGGYIKWTADLFNSFDKILQTNGSILYNLSYGNENTCDMFLCISEIINNTNFTLQDCIVWKKSTALPNNCSPNKLTRITEFIFVFCRKGEEKTFKSNKKHISTRENGQKMYENIYNFIEAKNNDGSCNLNKATYSSELCEKILNIYALPNSIVYDPFMGTGTTAVACKKMDLNCFGSELSKAQCEYAKNRLDEIKK